MLVVVLELVVLELVVLEVEVEELLEGILLVVELLEGTLVVELLDGALVGAELLVEELPG